ncbi:unnamed protein product [Paramecium sonneborni]|uniref:Transmembrane protein n=1 Tax=Paramecium sonneborni TaxID=65129 RepID=A0A8S1MUN9_9CILI|nr:unnamed protein product [Paramecium sonneborni]
MKQLKIESQKDKIMLQRGINNIICKLQIFFNQFKILFFQIICLLLFMLYCQSFFVFLLYIQQISINI